MDSFMSTQDSHLQLLKKKDCPRPLSSDDIQQVVIKNSWIIYFLGCTYINTVAFGVCMDVNIPIVHVQSISFPMM